MLAKIKSVACLGLDSKLVEVECDISNGLPSLIIVGLGDKAVSEARDRLRGALKNSHLSLPPKHLTINLAPADLPKDGTGYDLPMAIAILVASGQLTGELSDHLFFGELSLDGRLRPARGALSAAQAAKDLGCTGIFLPQANAKEAALVDGLNIYPAENLLQIFRHLSGLEDLPRAKKTVLKTSDVKITTDIKEIVGQDIAKRCLEIAAAGNHNLLMSGSPGSGKTMLAKALPGLLPPPDGDEVVTITKLQSLAGQLENHSLGQRPFRNPHHTASIASMAGGGPHPKPGEISLSHHGVLLLDELPEFPRPLLESLRQPLEDGRITVSRASGHLTYPADFILVATRNPCPCGYLGDSLRSCNCTQAEINRYNKRLSGPLLDRIDIHLNVERVRSEQLTREHTAESSQAVVERVAAARVVQTKRLGPGRTNGSMTSAETRQTCSLPAEAKLLAEAAINRLALSTRSYFRTLKVARTIADLAGSVDIQTGHLAEALQYRSTA